MTSQEFLKGKLLISMPGMADYRFNEAVIYICAHSSDGAMGLVINHLAKDNHLSNLLEDMNINTSKLIDNIKLQSGGPVETIRGFVLHSNDYYSSNTIKITNEVYLTSSVDILKAISKGDGPKKTIIALGYAGWGPGQLEEEIQENIWLHAQADNELLFNCDLDKKWQESVNRIGINLSRFSINPGHA